MKILVLGITGLLGNAMFRILSEHQDLDVFGTTRSDSSKAAFNKRQHGKIISGVDVHADWDAAEEKLTALKPDVVVNCVGVVKQLEIASDPLITIPINALLPHRLAQFARRHGGRLIHISTDCVFSGSKGLYKETDVPDARDLYGLSKYLGEVAGPGCITLRTSIIGHELGSTNGLVEWFLSQKGSVNGYARAIFSGFPTYELSRIIRDIVLPRTDLEGVYQVASQPISKFDLLTLIAAAYGKDTVILKDEEVAIDRSLDGTRFNAETGYSPPPWQALVKEMHDFETRCGAGE
jgi:dTDP-4-dehydrorhamnose reductase